MIGILLSHKTMKYMPDIGYSNIKCKSLFVLRWSDLVNFSYFYLFQMMPEEEPLSEKSPDLALKLGLMFGLLPRTGF